MLRSFVKLPAGREIAKAHVKLIDGLEWFCTNGAGRGTIMTTGKGAAPTPPDHVVLAFGSCFGASVRRILENKGHKVNDIKIEIDAEWEFEPKQRIRELRANCIIDADGVDQALADSAVQQAEEQVCMIASTLKRGPSITVK